FVFPFNIIMKSGATWLPINTKHMHISNTLK
ncbi:hypothetical protein, partial [Plasmodium yoelii yoelii]